MATEYYAPTGVPIDGVYAILPSTNKSMRWDVSNGSVANGSRIQVYNQNTGPDGTGNHQKFFLFTIPENTSYQLIASCLTADEAGLYRHVEYSSRGSTSTAGTNSEIASGLSKNPRKDKFIELWIEDGTPWRNIEGYRWWKLIRKDYNNVRHFYIQSKGASNYVIDVADGRPKKNGQWTWVAGDDLLMWPKDSSSQKDQLWEFRKDVVTLKSLPVPSSLGLEYTASTGGTSYGSLVFDNTTNANNRFAYFTWVCQAINYQLRYMIEGRKIGTDTWVTVQSWRSWKDGSLTTDEDGWGNVWGYTTCKSSDSTIVNRWNNNNRKTTSGNCRVQIPSTFNQSGGYDRFRIKYQVRSFTKRTKTIDYTDSNGYGYVYDIEIPYVSTIQDSGYKYIDWKPTVTIDSFAFTPDGIKMGYTSDYKRNNNKSIKIGKIKGPRGYLTNREFSYSGKPYTGTITIPMREMNYIPENAENFTFTFYIQTSDGQSRTQTFTKPLSYSSNHGLSINGGFTYHDGGIIKLKPSTSYANSECHIIYKQDGETLISDCEMDINGYYIIIPPFDKAYTVMLSASSSDNAWGVKAWAGQIVHGEGHMFNFGTDYFRLFLQNAPYSGPEGSYSADTQSYLFQGDRREAVYFGKGATVSQSISGLVPIDQTIQLDGAKYPYPSNCSLEDFHRMRNAKYAVYRDLYGRRYDVAIINTNESPYDENLFNVSISMKERM